MDFDIGVAGLPLYAADCLAGFSDITASEDESGTAFGELSHGFQAYARVASGDEDRFVAQAVRVAALAHRELAVHVQSDGYRAEARAHEEYNDHNVEQHAAEPCFVEHHRWQSL